MMQILNSIDQVYYHLGFLAFIHYGKIDSLKVALDIIDLLSDLMWHYVSNSIFNFSLLLSVGFFIPYKNTKQ